MRVVATVALARRNLFLIALIATSCRSVARPSESQDAAPGAAAAGDPAALENVLVLKLDPVISGVSATVFIEPRSKPLPDIRTFPAEVRVPALGYATIVARRAGYRTFESKVSFGKGQRKELVLRLEEERPSPKWGWFGLSAEDLPQDADFTASPPRSGDPKSPVLEYVHGNREGFGKLGTRMTVDADGHVWWSVTARGANPRHCRAFGQKLSPHAFSRRTQRIGRVHVPRLQGMLAPLRGIPTWLETYSKEEYWRWQGTYSAYAYLEGASGTRRTLLASDGRGRERSPYVPQQVLAWLVALYEEVPKPKPPRWSLLEARASDKRGMGAATAQVFVDGRFVGKTPLERMCIRPGRHEIAFVLNRRKKQVATEVGAGKVASESVTFSDSP